MHLILIFLMLNCIQKAQHKYKMKIEKDLLNLVKSMLVIKINPKKLGLGIHEKWNSLAHLKILLEVEKKFKIKFTMKEMTEIKSFKEILQQINKKKIIEKNIFIYFAKRS